MTIGLLSFAINLSVYISEGDSISTDAFSIALGNGVPAYGGQYSALRTGVVYHNIASVGATLADLQSRSPAPSSYKSGGKNVLSVLIGHNDIVNGYPVGGTQAGFLTALATYLDTQRSAGLKVVLGTLLPSTAAISGGGSFNTARNAINTVLAGWVGTHCDALCDFAASSPMGPDAAASNTSLYGDGVHPTGVGQTDLEAVIQPVLDTLV